MAFRCSVFLICSYALPPDVSSEALGNRLATAGFELSFRSGYLRRRNWIQVSLMGECSRERLEALLVALRTDGRGGVRRDDVRMRIDRDPAPLASSA